MSANPRVRRPENLELHGAGGGNGQDVTGAMASEMMRALALWNVLRREGQFRQGNCGCYLRTDFSKDRSRKVS